MKRDGRVEQVRQGQWKMDRNLKTLKLSKMTRLRLGDPGSIPGRPGKGFFFLFDTASRQAL
jgi:hypothetical protein